MVAYALDYSAGRPTAAQVKAAGYVGVARYIGFPDRRKCITKAEYDDMTAAGVGVALVFEEAAGDALGGRAAGARAASLARTHANAIGFPPGLPIYYACDTDVVTASQFAAVLDYLRGAAGVDGAVGRVGVYGEYDVVERAAAAGVAGWFWQTRAWSGGRVNGRAHLRQELGQVTVGGISCDRNTILAADWGQTGHTTQEETLNSAELKTLSDKLDSIQGGVDIIYRGDFPVPKSGQTHANITDIAAAVNAVRVAVGALSDDEAHILAAVRASDASIEAAIARIATGGPVTDPAVFAKAVIAELGAAVTAGEART